MDKPECEHDNWTITGNEKIGRCTCEDCGKEIWLYDGINRSINKLRDLENQLKILINIKTTPNKPGRPRKNG